MKKGTREGAFFMAYQNQPLVVLDSSTSSIAHSISAASARFSGWDRLALLGSTETASMYTTEC